MTTAFFAFVVFVVLVVGVAAGELSSDLGYSSAAFVLAGEAAGQIVAVAEFDVETALETAAAA